MFKVSPTIEFTQFDDLTRFEAVAGLAGAATGGFAAHELIAYYEKPYDKAAAKVSKLESQARQIRVLQADAGLHAKLAVKQFLIREEARSTNQVAQAVSAEPLPYTLQAEEAGYVVCGSLGIIAVALAANSLRHMLWRQHNRKIYKTHKDMYDSVHEEIESLLTNDSDGGADGSPVI
jgi:hypothetical protein